VYTAESIRARNYKLKSQTEEIIRQESIRQRIIKTESIRKSIRQRV
jgi:hypothetical protein